MAGEVKLDPSSLNLWQKLSAITAEVGSIAKGGQNREQGYKFIEYAAVAGALRTLFGRYNVMCVPNMGERHETEIESKYKAKGYHVLIDFTFTFVNSDKPDEKLEIKWIGEATDYGDKGTNKAATSALKYCLMRTFNVSEQGEEDPDAHTPPETTATTQNATAKQKFEILHLLRLMSIEGDAIPAYVTEKYKLDVRQLTRQSADTLLEALRKDAAKSMEPES